MNAKDEFGSVTRIGKPSAHPSTPYQRKKGSIGQHRSLSTRVEERERYRQERKRFEPRAHDSTPFIERAILWGSVCILLAVLVATSPALDEIVARLTPWVLR